MKIKVELFITVVITTVLIIIASLIFELNARQMTDIFQTALLLNILEKALEISNQEIEVQIFEREKFKKEEDDNFGS